MSREGSKTIRNHPFAHDIVQQSCYKGEIQLIKKVPKQAQR